ncbi:sigma-70 family RNA polymerase sigma factor [Verrucomicrobiaceae bacterium N1E253]|uniref:Sigma-70 family RNA polymerase sigma factor n=1 Tax=Oceaniferula marina TaxID=2748318 RepID=A0A851GD12_9BACT|nr:sigma-70 family RNA polymerase sigma factor [Oceaniferula marina]NWK55069.1 sigma-70 family RNA polymerase sigma factor [Oceaniferula marina]
MEISEKQTSSTPPAQNQAQDGDDFVVLLTAHQGAVHAFLHSLLPGDPGVEDVLQRTNLTLWKKRQDFEIGTNFKAWAFAIARWEARAWLTSQKRQNWLVFDDELTDHIIEQSEQLPDVETNGDGSVIRALRLCLAGMNDKQRSLVMHYYQQEKSIKECSSITGRSSGSLRVTLFRIRTSLRHCIETKLAAKGETA